MGEELLGRKEVANYRRLWLHILKQAVRDIRPGNSSNVRREAYRYILVPNQDFAIAADMLGIHPIQLRDRLVKLIINEEDI